MRIKGGLFQGSDQESNEQKHVDFPVVVGITSNQILLTFILACSLWMFDFCLTCEAPLWFRGLIACEVWLGCKKASLAEHGHNAFLEASCNICKFYGITGNVGLLVWRYHLGSCWRKPRARMTHSILYIYIYIYIYVLRMLPTQLHETLSSKWLP